jgi:hypothetical protein
VAEKYQRCAKKSTKKFEVLGKKELAVRVPLPLVGPRLRSMPIFLARP